MSLFIKLIKDIIYNDIETFCNEWTEGIRVEYKSDFPQNKDLRRSIISFANTQGGIILIGVEANKDGKVVSFDGIKKEDGLKDKITNSCVNGIYPSIVPDIAIIEKPNSSNIFVVIKIAISLSGMAKKIIFISADHDIFHENGYENYFGNIHLNRQTCAKELSSHTFDQLKEITKELLWSFQISFPVDDWIDKLLKDKI